jgi:hypothetical protein
MLFRLVGRSYCSLGLSLRTNGAMVGTMMRSRGMAGVAEGEVRLSIYLPVCVCAHPRSFFFWLFLLPPSRSSHEQACMTFTSHTVQRWSPLRGTRCRSHMAPSGLSRATITCGSASGCSMSDTWCSLCECYVYLCVRRRRARKKDSLC